MTTSDWISVGALATSIVTLGYTIYSGRQNAKDTRAAQKSAEKANDISQEANELAQQANIAVQQSAEAQSRPHLAFVQEQVAGVWCGFIKNLGNAPAEGIEINVKVADDAPPDQRGTVETIADNLVRKYRGVSMGPGERHDVCSLFYHLNFIEVTSLRYRNSQGKQFFYLGRAPLLREGAK